MAHEVFISHAHKDKSIAHAICEKLETAQLKCWIADRDISAGEDWTEGTRKAIGSSRVMLLVLSENANAAPHIEREIAHAFYTKRIIVPWRLTKTFPRRDFLFYLGNARWVDAVNPPAEEHLEALTATISNLIGAKIVTKEALLPDGRVKITAPLGFSDSWLGSLQASHYQTLGLLKRVGLAGAAIGVACLLWFAFWETKDQGSPAESHRQARPPAPSPDLSAAVSGDSLASKPAYTYSRFGLWVANTSPTPQVQPQPSQTPAATSDSQPRGAKASPLPDKRSIRNRTKNQSAREPSRQVAHQESQRKSCVQWIAICKRQARIESTLAPFFSTNQRKRELSAQGLEHLSTRVLECTLA
jgi:hypothetical protein